MTAIKPPNFPTLTPEILGDKLDAMRAKVEEATSADGTVDIQLLAKKVTEAKDPALTQKLAVIMDAFERQTTVTRMVSGCGGPRATGTTTVREAPSQLDEAEVSSVMKALLSAKASAQKLDKNNDGVLSEQ